MLTINMTCACFLAIISISASHNLLTLHNNK
jgi:hypothetical protein